MRGSNKGWGLDAGYRHQGTNLATMPTGKDIRAKNERNARNHREGKTKPRPSHADRVAKKPAVSQSVIYFFCFVVIGGVFVELIRLFF